ncbi:unnamed protein product [Leptidea sinapis]|uniref:Uncharacterized protein n=1 Tax=Leptidea sinapis TaxID=189913 RepID=A0A5E4QTS9_9NEOP|nr:unnamed protein product [Leptidea sinapis]
MPVKSFNTSLSSLNWSEAVWDVPPMELDMFYRPDVVIIVFTDILYHRDYIIAIMRIKKINLDDIQHASSVLFNKTIYENE